MMVRSSASLSKVSGLVVEKVRPPPISKAASLCMGVWVKDNHVAEAPREQEVPEMSPHLFQVAPVGVGQVSRPPVGHVLQVVTVVLVFL